MMHAANIWPIASRVCAVWQRYVSEAIADKCCSLFEQVVVVDDEDRENEGDLIMAVHCVYPFRMCYEFA